MSGDPVMRAQVVVLGATPAGLAAAMAAGDAGRRVLVLERGAHLGGLPANGLGITDIATRGSVGGLFAQFIALVREHYVQRYGPDSPQVRDCSDGYHFEPHVAEMILRRMLALRPSVQVLLHRQFDADDRNVRIQGQRLVALRVLDRRDGSTQWIEGDCFIDAGYEGDLAAAAGVPFRVGRESTLDTGEPFAGRVYWSWSTRRVLEGSSGAGDDAVQAFNFRLCMTNDPARRVPITRPTDYRREDYLRVIDDVAGGRLRHAVYRYPRAAVAKPVPIPNGKFDVNDHPKSLISTDLPEENWAYPTADWAWRDRFEQRLRDYELGLLWFCQHDEALPEAFRLDAQQWGLACDEFVDHDCFPRQMYVREARRIEGVYTFSALDCIAAADVPLAAAIVAGEAAPAPDQRPPVHRDSVTAAHYPIDSHACRKAQPGHDALDGYFALNEITRPYTVPYRVMLPREVDGLLVPVACSATHLGFGTLRMEPCWMALGEAAGVAADLALRLNMPLREAPIAALQRGLLARGAVLFYCDDLPSDPDQAAALQIIGLRGGVAGYMCRPTEPIDAPTLQHWRQLLGVTSPPRAGCDEPRGRVALQLLRQSQEFMP
jgi:hypothetical protein